MLLSSTLLPAASLGRGATAYAVKKKAKPMQQKITREVAGRLLAAQGPEGAFAELANREPGCVLCSPM